jgi:hypothetical protein
VGNAEYQLALCDLGPERDGGFLCDPLDLWRLQIILSTRTRYDRLTKSSYHFSLSTNQRTEQAVTSDCLLGRPQPHGSDWETKVHNLGAVHFWFLG